MVQSNPKRTGHGTFQSTAHGTYVSGRRCDHAQPLPPRPASCQPTREHFASLEVGQKLTVLKITGFDASERFDLTGRPLRRLPSADNLICSFPKSSTPVGSCAERGSLFPAASAAAVSALPVQGKQDSLSAWHALLLNEPRLFSGVAVHCERCWLRVGGHGGRRSSRQDVLEGSSC